MGNSFVPLKTYVKTNWLGKPTYFYVYQFAPDVLEQLTSASPGIKVQNPM